MDVASNLSTFTIQSINDSLNTFRYLGLFSGALFILICVCGMFGNLLSAVVFLHRSFRRRSINILLAALSITDFGLLFLGIPVFASAPLVTYKPEWTGLDVVYVYCLAYVFPVTVMFQCMSAWLLILITIERWMAVCKPFLVEAYCTRKRAIWATVAVFVLSMSVNMVRFWEFEVDTDTHEPMFNLRNDSVYMLWYSTVTQLLILYVVPLCVLLALNVHVTFTIIRARSLHAILTNSQKRVHNTATMLVCVVLVFISSYGMSFALILTELFNPTWFYNKVGSAVSDLNNILAVLNSATTSIFYFKFSCRYRNQARYLLTRTRIILHSEYTTRAMPRIRIFTAPLTRNNQRRDTIKISKTTAFLCTARPVDSSVEISASRRRSSF